MKNHYCLCLITVFMSSVCPLMGQTYYYERVKTVTNGRSSEDTGDGHFITFTSKGCYDSDRNGMAEKKVFREYLSFENDIYKYYGYYGDFWRNGKAYYFFSSDKSRLNIRLEEKDVVYVYVKKTPPSGLTAKMRGYRAPSESSGSSSSSTVFVPVVPPPVVIGGSGASGGSGYSGPTRRQCTACNGTGKGWSEIVYAPNYTGSDNSRYCAECGCVSSAHTHIHHRCTVCSGKGYLEY